MTLRQWLLRLAYPLYSFITRLTNSRGAVISNTANARPNTSLYELDIILNNGATLSLSAFRGKKLLFVNTASDCIYTAQYAELERMYENCRSELVIFAFPSNDFNQQEQGTDKEIEDFCKTNFHVAFPIAAKSAVSGKDKNAVYDWLTDPAKNGWNSRSPDWNFAKYLVDEQGVLSLYLGPAVHPAALFSHIAGKSAC